MSDIAVFDQALILTGPTASGKSTLALSLAERLKGEIISMDSMAVYRGMDLGTAKPSRTDRERVPHHLIDCLDPSERATVAWWLNEAAGITREIQQRGKLAIIVGGTPLYLKALRFGLFQGPAIDPATRAALEFQEAASLFQQLQNIDPVAARRIHANDHRRLVRAMEVYQQSGKPLTEWQREFDREPRRRQKPVVCITLPRDELYRRIEARIDAMMQAGWLEEVRSLQQLPCPMSKEAAQAAGYRELADHLEGRCTLEEAIVATKTRSRQLAKRQLTWFRHFPGLKELSLPEAEQYLVATYLP